MFGRAMRHRVFLASIMFAAACMKTAPNTDRPTFRVDVTNAYAYPMNVIVRHDGGFTILGVIPPGESREYDVRMWQPQPVRIVATPLDGFQKLDKSTRVGLDCTARVVFQDVHIGRPIAGRNHTEGNDEDGDKPAADAQRNHDKQPACAADK